MIETFAETVAVCWLAVVGMFVGALILIDRRTQRRWKPIEVDRGEIVEPRQ
ncbi:hypothetical protein BJD60_gp45 [Gordonia phage Schnabeltier]|uniref:Uncharacterized protein n=1 Tax=Gordonia phage Schnabeltier TaxID=1821561 RepID=A0A142KA33_9CAUD|nr:hypothetical protein BJD60_gp45 [Gordonia phage Schnabeltier]AMS02966.1 hypothetical protein SEA_SCHNABELTIER_45 [Gordonia phage Schnabeltier]